MKTIGDFFVLAVAVVMFGFSGPEGAIAETKKAEAAPPVPQVEKATPPPSQQAKKPKKNIFGEDIKKREKREGWAARELRKDGYDPNNLTGKDFRKMMGAE